MIKRTYTVILTPAQPDERGYSVEVPILPGCFTDGKTVEDAICNAKEAVEGYILSLMDDGLPIPEENNGVISMIASVTVEV